MSNPSEIRPADADAVAPNVVNDGPTPARSSRDLAIASMILSSASLVWFMLSVVGFPWMWICGIGTIMAGVGAVLGHVARRRSPPGIGGYDLALAGAIIGWVAASLGLLSLAIFGLATYLEAGTS